MQWLFRRSRSPQQNVPSVSNTDIGTENRLGEVETLLAQKRNTDALVLLDELEHSLVPSGESLIRLARVRRLAGQATHALTLCDRALATECEPACVHIECAECYRALHDLPAAVDALRIATALDPASATAWLMLGDLLLQLQQAHEALDALERAEPLLADPKCRTLLLFLLGQCLAELGRFAEACASLRACLEIDKSVVGAHIALGHALLREDDELGAIEAYQAAIRQSPQALQTVRLNLSIALVNIGHYEEARRHLTSILHHKPSDHVARWYLCQLDLLHCQWEAGWKNYAARFGAGASPYRPMPYRPWEGQPLKNETLLVLADQGLGDEIMFASCFEDLHRHAEHSIIECEPRLLKLFQRSFPYFHFVPTKRQNDTSWLRGLPEPHWQIPSGDLPRFFRQSETDFPSTRNAYLRPDPARHQYWMERLSALPPGVRVGISWRGGTSGTRAKTRSIALDHWGAILKTTGAQFVNLQYGNYREELEELERIHHIQIHDFPEANDDYDETAALVASLDLVVSVCTAVVHLGGALGVPVWILTPFAPGWRYTADRSSLPWYPTTRIFRQTSPGDWPSACKKLSVELNKVTNRVTRECA